MSIGEAAKIVEQLKIVRESMATIENGLIDGSLSAQAETTFAQMLAALAVSLRLHADKRNVVQ